MKLRNKRGAILITALWILTILSILAAGIGFRVSVEARLNKYGMDRVRGLYLAKAGIVKCAAILAKDQNSYDSIRECGITLAADRRPENIFAEKSGEGAFNVSYEEEGKAYYGMADEARKIPINTAPPEVIVNLLGAGNEDVAASIINWRGQVRMPKGAWDDDYGSLQAPYKCKHSDLCCIEELKLVKGMTDEIFSSIMGYITVYGNADGKVNINTASKRVMLAMGLSEGLASIVMDIRSGPDKLPGTGDDGVFDGDIMQRLGVSIDSSDKTVLENRFTTASNYFRIEAKGIVDRSKIISRIVCVVKKGETKLKFYREY